MYKHQVFWTRGLDWLRTAQSAHLHTPSGSTQLPRVPRTKKNRQIVTLHFPRRRHLAPLRRSCLTTTQTWCGQDAQGRRRQLGSSIGCAGGRSEGSHCSSAGKSGRGSFLGPRDVRGSGPWGRPGAQAARYVRTVSVLSRNREGGMTRDRGGCAGWTTVRN